MTNESADKTALNFFAKNESTFKNLLQLKETPPTQGLTIDSKNALDDATCKLIGQRAYRYWLENL